MSGAKEIRTKIKSVQSTQKITRAMEMVAASKMRKAQDRMLTSRPYAKRIRSVIEHVSLGHSEYRHPFLESRTKKKIGLIVVSSDRGLCGGLNSNLFRFLVSQLQTWGDEGFEVNLCLMGTKAQAFFKSLGLSVMGQVSKFGDQPSVSDVVGPVGVMLEGFYEKRLDALYIAHNEFVSTMNQRPHISQLLPIVPESFVVQDSGPSKEDLGLKEKKQWAKYWDYIYEPDAKEILDVLFARYIESQVYQAVVENFACEQAARMVAMKSASDNAGQLIDDLRLVYNKARQASITQELSEIVSGAAAV